MLGKKLLEFGIDKAKEGVTGTISTILNGIVVKIVFVMVFIAAVSLTTCVGGSYLINQIESK